MVNRAVDPARRKMSDSSVAGIVLLWRFHAFIHPDRIHSSSTPGLRSLTGAIEFEIYGGGYGHRPMFAVRPDHRSLKLELPFDITEHFHSPADSSPCGIIQCRRTLVLIKVESPPLPDLRSGTRLLLFRWLLWWH